jgi:putative hydrolase of the HAD superfamily
VNERSHIRAVTFDAGGTLIEPWPSVGHVYAEVAARFGLGNIAPAELNRQFIAAWKSRQPFDYSREAWRKLVDQTLAGLCANSPNAKFFDALYRRFGRADAWRVFDDVLPLLTQLKARGFKLGVISNWDERLRVLLAELRLLEWFDAVAISHEIGCAKPDREIFWRTVGMLHLPARSVLHVGDGRCEDADGAKAAGLGALLLTRGQGSSHGNAVSSLSAVVWALGRTSQQTPSD